MDILIERDTSPGQYVVLADGEQVGSIKSKTRGGYDVTVRFGDELPQPIDREITAAVPVLSLAKQTARALSAVGRESRAADINELAPGECYCVEVVNETGAPVTMFTANPESADFVRRIMTSALQAAQNGAR